MFATHKHGIDVLGATEYKPRDAVGKGGGGHHHGGGGHFGRGLGWYLDDDDDDGDVNIIQNFISTEGVEVLGFFDVGAEQKKMNALKTVPVRVAQPLLKYGMQTIDQARKTADDKNLPGKTARDNVYWKLQWHKQALQAVAGNLDAIYMSGDDLKHWVMQAFIEANAVEEGAKALDDAWSAMWSEIGAAIAALPKEVAKTVGEVAVGATNVAKWVIGAVAGVLVLVGLVKARRMMR